MVNTRRMARTRQAGRAGALSRDDWIRAAAREFAEHGVGAVAVEPLAKRLGVTKGSFYWHFPNREALLRATLERWEQENTEDIIATLSQIPDPRLRLEQLILLAFSGAYNPANGDMPEIDFDDAFDLAVADASDDPIVQPIFRRVSERRVDYLTEAFRALGCSPEEARYRGLLGYAAYVGTLRLAREAPSRLPGQDELQDYQRQVIAAILPANRTGGQGTAEMD